MSQRKSWVVRIEREAAVRRKELLARQRAQAKAAELSEAAHQVEAYENHRKYLLSMHADCGADWDWSEVATRTAPPPPQPPHANEDAARARHEEFKPSIWDKLFGRVDKKRAALAGAIRKAQVEDDTIYQQLRDEHAEQLERHEWETRVAKGILTGDLGSYADALAGLEPFAELADAWVKVNVQSLLREVATIQCVVDRRVLPEDEKKLTNSGKLTTKPLANAAKWTMHEEFVASCALRVAREVFAVLPVDRAVVNVVEPGVDASTGLDAMLTLLAVSVDRAVFQRFRFENLDPVASLKNLPNRIDFKKSTGFEPVEPMTDSETFMMMTRARG